MKQKAIRRIMDFAEELNKLEIPIIVHQAMRCRRCRQQIGKISNDHAAAYPCLNANCGSFSDYHTIKGTWEKLVSLEAAN